MNISIIIPNFNGRVLLEKNLPVVLEAIDFYKKNTKSDVEIIIIDDDSTDDSVDFLSKQKDITVLSNAKNLGFSSTVNKGIKNSSGDIVVLLNTDVSPEKDFLISLIEHFSDEKVFAVGCMDKSREEGKIVLRGRGLGEWRRGFLVHRRGEVNTHSTLWVSGGSGAFRKSILEKIGSLDELYNPFYWEDIDLSYRALKSGYRVMFEPKSVVLHEHEKGIIQSLYSKREITSIAYRNQFIFVWKNASGRTLISHLEWLGYHYVKALLRGDGAWFNGFFQALFLLPSVLNSRKSVQKHFTKTDDEVISELES